MPTTRIEAVAACRGCSLIEALVATAIFMVAAGVLAQLVAFAARTNREAARTSIATIVAQQKIEELLPELAGPASLSAADTLSSSLTGSFDFVDRDGRPLGAGLSPPVGSAYLRRWSVDPATDGDVLIVQVAVIDVRDAIRTSGTAVSSRNAEQVRLLTATTRRAF
jgi:type II secretory pathway pseudopilin PulG